MNQEGMHHTRYIPISKWPHSWPPAGGFRHLIFHQETNGFGKVIKRVGRRILIDEKAFFEWVENSDQVERGK